MTKYYSEKTEQASSDGESWKQNPQILSTDIVLTNFDAFYKLKERFLDESDETIARFIIARSYDVEKASMQLSKHIAWRKDSLPIFKNNCLKELSTAKGYSIFMVSTKKGIL